MILQTLAMNGPFSNTVTFDNRREMSWTGGSHPETLTMRHLEQLAGSDAHFARKFDDEVDAEILQTLARGIGARPPGTVSGTFFR